MIQEETAMDFKELAKERFSVRDFSDRPVEDEKIRDILETGLLAPTAKNLQPQRVYVLKSEKAVAKARELSKMAFNAPVVLMISARKGDAFVSPFNGMNFAETDASIATTHMMLRAAEIGLGTCWVGYFDPKAFAEAFDVPDDEEVLYLMPLGYAAEGCEPRQSHFDSRTVEDTVREL